jgi:hypothetical protein
MREVECPVCSSPSVLALSKRCCTRCGWNVLRARENLHKVRLFPFIWLALTAFVFVLGMSDRGKGSLADLLVPTAFFAGVGLWSWLGLRRARATILGHDGDVDPGALQAADHRQRQEWEWILQTLPLREVHLTRKGKSNLMRSTVSVFCINVIFALCIAGNYWLLQREHSPQAGKLLHLGRIYTIAMLVIYTFLYSGFLIFYHSRARRLLAGGQAVIGKLVDFERTSSGSILNVEFSHPSGKVGKARGSSRSEAYFEGMTMPVFCNPLKLKDCFAFLKDGDYEIIRPGLSNSS